MLGKVYDGVQAEKDGLVSYCVNDFDGLQKKREEIIDILNKRAPLGV